MLYFAVVLGALLAAAGQICLKSGATGQTSAVGLMNLSVLGGVACLGLGQLLWLVAMTKLPLHVVYPFTLLTLGVVFFASIAWLGERPSPMSIVGWAVIAAGVALVVLSMLQDARH
jgi:drug/metabolite transporter (DMT)-like permease